MGHVSKVGQERERKKAVVNTSAMLVMAGKWGRKTGSMPCFTDSTNPLTLESDTSCVMFLGDWPASCLGVLARRWKESLRVQEVARDL